MSIDQAPQLSAPSENDGMMRTWDAAYGEGKYVFDPPVPFAGEIVSFVQEKLPAGSHGLYVGCGNGRNFAPMVEAGLHLDGIDLSTEGIEQTRDKLPGYEGTLAVGDFHDLPDASWDYLVSMQVFQFGDTAASREHFVQAARLLKPGGMLFLRVNSASTEIDLAHDLVEGQEGASRTAVYGEGHKSAARIPVHYYEHDELEAVAADTGFSIITPLRETHTDRETPRRGHWSQWEAIWQKQGAES